MRVNGALLGKCVNKRVSIIGTVHSVHPSNMGFNINTSDNQTLTVNLSKALGENVTGLIEVHGIAQGPTSLNCDYYLTFPYGLASTYDAEMDNEAVTLGFQVANAWK